MNEVITPIVDCQMSEITLLKSQLNKLQIQYDNLEALFDHEKKRTKHDIELVSFERSDNNNLSSEFETFKKSPDFSIVTEYNSIILEPQDNIIISTVQNDNMIL